MGENVGALVAGSLLESSGGVGRSRLRWLEYWVAVNIIVLLWGLFCILVPRSCTSVDAPSMRPLTRVLGDPDCICASLAQDTFDIDVDIC